MIHDSLMHAMVLEQPGKPLKAKKLPIPVAGPFELLIKVQACGICRTDLHVTDGELQNPKLPLIPGHQIVGWWRRSDRLCWDSIRVIRWVCPG